MAGLDLTPYLEDLESRLDPATETSLRQEWIDFLDGRFEGTVFSPKRPKASPPGISWPEVRVNQALDDYDAMALQQFSHVSAALAAGSGGMLCVRCNYGVGILPSLFGVRTFLMDDEQNTLPNVWPLDGGIEAIREKLAAGLPDLNGGYGGKVFEMGKYFVKLMAPYPRIRQFVHIYHPDLQGPMDVCELLWGSGLFMDLLDQPDLVTDFLDLITDTYIAFMTRWKFIVPPSTDGYSAHWSMLHKGHIFLRDDSAMNLSPEMFQTFIQPYDQRLLDVCGGGCVHFCGRGDHYIASLTSMRNLHGVNMSQPELNNMETIYTHTLDQGIPLLGFPRVVAEAAHADGRDLHSRLHCA